MDDDSFEIIQKAAANIGSLMCEIVPETETELYLRNLVQELCMHIVEMSEALEDDD